MKKWLCFLVAGVMLLSMTACGTKPDTAGENHQATPTGTTEESQKTSSGATQEETQKTPSAGATEETLPQSPTYSTYDSFLEALKSEQKELYYDTRDIDGNGVKELLVKEGTKLTVYTLAESVTKVDTYDFYTGTVRLFYSNNTNCPGIFSFTVGGGANHYGYMTIQNGKIVLEKLWDEVYSLPADSADRVQEFSANKERIAESKGVYAQNLDIQFTKLGTQDTQQILSPSDQVLLQVLRNQKSFSFVSGWSGVLKDFKLGNVDLNALPERYTLVDFDNDGTNELVVYVTPSYGAYMVFHLDGETVYGFEIAGRAMIDLKTDGTFMGSGAAAVTGWFSLRFNDNRCEFVENAFKEDLTQTYRLNGKPATEAAVKAYIDAFTEKENVIWNAIPK